MTTYNWKSAANGSWNNATLWDPTGGPVVRTTPNVPSDYSLDTAVFNTGSATGYAISGTGHAIAIQIAHDTVIFDSFNFTNNGNDGTQAFPTLTVTDGATVLLGPNASVNLQEQTASNRAAFGKVTVNNATLLVQGGLTGTLDIQNKGVITVAKGGALSTPNSGQVSGPLAVIEAGGTLNVQSGATANADLQDLSGTLNVDGATVKSGFISATGAINGSNGSTLTGLTYLYAANTNNQGTITAAAGIFAISGSIGGTGKLLINPGTTLVLNSTDTNAISFVSDGATLALTNSAKISGTLNGFGKGDAVNFEEAKVTNLTVSDTNGLTTVTAYSAATPLNSFTLAGDYSLADLAFTSDGRGGSLISYVDHTPAPPPVTTPPVTASSDSAPPPTATLTTTPPAPGFSITNTSTGATSTVAGEAYTGPVAGIDTDYITITTDNLAIGAVTPNVFIHTGSGDDAIRVLSGRNVLDGGTGSNFLTGGTGTDTFFVDARNAPSDTWSTVVGAHTGDDVTVFGITPANFAIAYVDGQGAVGSLGLTMHATSSTQPTASFTLAGFSRADLASGKVSAVFGANGSEPYLNLHVN